jgi:hypothetical protein
VHPWPKRRRRLDRVAPCRDEFKFSVPNPGFPSEYAFVNCILRRHTVIASWEAPCPNPDLPCDEVLSLHYFSDNLTACIVLAGGDIVVVREEPLPGEDRIEIMGSVDAGITAAVWSPDEELLAITTKADTVVLMSRSFEGIVDVSMTSEDLKASNHVSVGWGKKETQFQGKGAKACSALTIILASASVGEETEHTLLFLVSREELGELSESTPGSASSTALVNQLMV